MAESPSSAVPALPGLIVSTVEWLPSGAESGLVRVRGRWEEGFAAEPDLPVLAMRVAGAEHRFESLPDARFTRDPSSWRGTYLVPAELVTVDPDALWLEWPSGSRCGLPALTRGVEPPPVPAAPERPEEPVSTGGQVIDRAVLAERRARRAEAAEQAQARVAAEALKAVEVLELRSAELERRLVAAPPEPTGAREALSAALASAAALRSRSREWQIQLRSAEVARAGDAVRLAVLEAERASGAGALRSALAERTRELDGALRAADERAAEARAELEAGERRFVEARSELDSVRAELATIRSEAEARAADLEAERTAHASLSGETTDLRARVAALEPALAVAEGRIQTAEAALTGAEARVRVESVARATLEDELDRERSARAAAAARHDEAERAAAADLEAERAATAELRATVSGLRSQAAAADDLRGALEAERESRRAVEAALEAEVAARVAAEEALAAARAETETVGATLQERITELERRAAPPTPEALARLATPHEPNGEADRVVADLDAAAEKLRGRVAEPLGEDETEPPAPDAEPWSEPLEATEDDPCIPGVEPARPATESDEPVPWAPPGFDLAPDDDGAEPPAPDAEPGVEWAPPVEPGPPGSAAESASDAVDEPVAPVVVAEPAAEPVAPVVVAEPAAEPVAPVVVSQPPPPAVEEPEPTGPVIVSAARPPSRALATGTGSREYPLLRGAIVKLAHDDAATAARLLVALLPAQGAAIEGPLAYDLTIREAGTFALSIAGGRASVEPIETPRSRADAEFHLTGDALVLAELLAGVDHRIRRFFGPVRVRGRKRRAKGLRALSASSIALPDAARAGAKLTPELVYRLFAYAVHPTWTRGHEFTVAQEIDGDATWYLSARDGGGVTVSSTAPDETPAATVSMSLETFGRLLRQEHVPAGQRPCVRGDLEAVALMRSMDGAGAGRGRQPRWVGERRGRRGRPSVADFPPYTGVFRHESYSWRVDVAMRTKRATDDRRGRLPRRPTQPQLTSAER